MDVGLELLQALLLRHAEMLLLVDDEKAQIAENDALGEERVRADDDVDAALGQFALHLGCVLAGDKPRQLLDPHRHAGEALEERAMVLARQERRRHDDGDLHPGHHRDERGAQRNLGLAEADIAADEPVHRPAGAQIAERVADRALLVLGLGIGEARGEFLVEALGRGKRLALAQLALGRDLDQLAGDVADALLDARLARLPGKGAQPVERNVERLRAIARQNLDVLDRHEQLVVAGIDDAQAIVRRAGDIERDEPVIAADAVLGMNDEIALRQRRHLGDEILVIGAAPRRPREPVAQNVLLGDERHVREAIAVLEREHGERGLAQRDRREIGPALDHGRIGYAMIAQQGSEALGRAQAVGGDERAAAMVALVEDVVAHGVEQIDALACPRLGEVAAGMRAGIDRGRPALAGKRRELADVAALQERIPLPVIEKKLLRLDRAIRRRRGARGPAHVAPRGIEIGDLLEPVAAHPFGLVVERHRRLGQIVEQRLEALVIKRQPVLHADIAPPRAHRLVQRIVVGDRAELLAIAQAEAADRVLVEQHLAHRPQDDGLGRARRALRQRIERAHPLDLFAEEIEPHGRPRARGKEIGDAAADREFARLAHRIGALIAVPLEERGEPVVRQPAAQRQSRECGRRTACAAARAARAR